MSEMFGYVGERQDAAEIVLSGLRQLDGASRSGAWEIAVGDRGQVMFDKRVGSNHLTTGLPQSALALGRACQSERIAIETERMHPQLDCSNRLAVVHEGTFINSAALRHALSRTGHCVRSHGDAELIAHVIEDLLEQIPQGDARLVRAVASAIYKLNGVHTITVLDAQRGELVAVTTGSPLCIGLAHSGYLLSSNHAALSEHTQRIGFLREGHALLLRRTGLNIYDMTGKHEIQLVASFISPRTVPTELTGPNSLTDKRRTTRASWLN